MTETKIGLVAAVFLQQDCCTIAFILIKVQGSGMTWYEFYLVNAGLLSWAEGQLFSLPKALVKDWGRRRDFPLGKNSSELVIIACPRYLIDD